MDSRTAAALDHWLTTEPEHDGALDHATRTDYVRQLAYHLTNDQHHARTLYGQIIDRTGSVETADELWRDARALRDHRSIGEQE